MNDLNTTERRELTEKWVNCRYLTCSERSVTQRFEAHQNGKTIKSFFQFHRTKFIPKKSINKIISEMNGKFNGTKYKKNEIIEKIQNNFIKKNKA